MSNMTSGVNLGPDKTQTGLITHYLNKNTLPNPINNKHLGSTLSLAEEEKSKKKANISLTEVKSIQNEQSILNEELTSNTELKDIIGPLVEEFKLLRESVHFDIKELQSVVTMQQRDVNKLEESIATSEKEVKDYLTDKIDVNTRSVWQIIEENKHLHKENDLLKDQITRIEISQLDNNVIISGQPEQPWDPYESTKERVIDIIAATIGSATDSYTGQETSKVEISCCSRIGGKPQPISVKFNRKEDKHNLMTNTRNLSKGIYVNEEFSIHIKKSHDTLHPMLRMAKSLPEYRDKCKLQNDWLVVDGITYTVKDLHRLPPDLAAYKAVQKTDSENIEFHGELSPWANFHKSPFE